MRLTEGFPRASAPMPVLSFQPFEPKLPAILSVPSTDAVRFGQTKVEKLSPTSRTFQVLSRPGNVTLNLRHWWPKGQPEPATSGKAPVFFFIHGLSGRSAWLAPLVDELLQKPENKNARFYGIDLPNIGQHPYREGNIEKMSDLIGQVRRAIEYLAERHEGPVYGIGLSLGGLLLSSVAANKKPEALTAMALLSPAYRPHPNKVSLGVYKNAVLKMAREKLTGATPKGISFVGPTEPPASSNQFTDLQKAILKQKPVARDRVDKLTFPSYLKMFARMKRFRELEAGKITIPVRVYATETDDLVDSTAIQQTFSKFASTHKELKVFPKALHDLILDPVNAQIAEELSRFFQGLTR